MKLRTENISDICHMVDGNDICVVCGTYVPEGRMVCPSCMHLLYEQDYCCPKYCAFKSFITTSLTIRTESRNKK